MLLNNQASTIISTYAADVSGVCSALFEYGGMTVMHDASGCNSTYNTHDEPRWYDSNSLVFISGLSEMDAVFGDDNKLVDDITETSLNLKPKFIAIAGTPIPMIMGTDFKAIAEIVQERTGIQSFGFNTNGMHSYLYGASLAFEALAENMTAPNIEKVKDGLSVNIIGTTPLDFSTNNYLKDFKEMLQKNHINVISEFGINGDLNKIYNAGSATVNLVLSSCGIKAAGKLYELYKTPYLFGMPVKGYEDKYISKINEIIQTQESGFFYEDFESDSDILVIAESALCFGLSHYIKDKYGVSPAALCPPDTENILISNGLHCIQDESMVKELMNNKKIVIADPLFKPICPENVQFVELPHEAFSGRMFRNKIYNLLEKLNFKEW